MLTFTHGKDLLTSTLAYKPRKRGARGKFGTKKTFFLASALLSLFVFGTCFIFYKSEEGGDPALARKRLDAADLYAEFQKDKSAAVLKYKDKILVVSGTVRYVHRDVAGTLFVILWGNDLFGSVQCYFTQDLEPRAAQLKTGDIVNVEGRCSGLVINVLMKECRIIKVVDRDTRITRINTNNMVGRWMISSVRL